MKPTKAIALFLTCCLVFVACTSSTTSSTSTTQGSSAGGSSAPGTTQDDEAVLDMPLPQDPDVRVGVLDTGMTYFIRRNDSPGGSAELRLMVDAGSVQEQEDQSGTAHFLEHMMFNGTARFPRNELIAALESFGPRFGPDINAFTSFDETVYELSLESTDELMDLGIEVLRQWAGEATLTATDVQDERGIVLDEWRLRAQGFGGRIGDELSALILPGTIYDGRLPIGEPGAIESTEPDVLERFYRSWYRPERMGLVAVGEFDVDEMEERIRASFEDFDREGDESVWEPPAYVSPTEVRAASLADEEAGGASVTVVWPVETHEIATIGDFQESAVLGMALDILSNRLNDDALRGTAPLLGSSPLSFQYTRAIDISGVDVQTRPDQIESALETVLLEQKRINEFGISDDEFRRAIDRFEAASVQRQEQKNTAQDVFFAEQIVSHHLAGGHLMSPDQQFVVEAGILDRLEKQDLERALAERTAVAPIVLVVGPDDLSASVPNADRILRIVAEVEDAEVVARDGDDEGIDTLMATPQPAEVLSRSKDPRYEYTTLIYPNGATVYLWPSDIAESGVFMLAESFGGTSLVAIEDLPEVSLISDILARSGVGPADAPTLQRLLSDRLVEVFPWMTETREGLTGSAATADVETMFQLVHLYLTAPRFDPVAVDAVLAEMATLNQDRADIPDIRFDEALNEGYYSGDPRYFVLPTDEQLSAFDVEAMDRVYRERYGNAGDFAFAFVGDFDVAEMTDLASRYIGTLPGTSELETWVDNQPLPPREIQVIPFEAGADPQGQIGLFFTNEFQPVLADRVTAQLLQLIVDARLRDRIREGLSATYSIRSGIDLQRDPDPFAEAFVISTGDPQDLGRISEEVMADLVDLQLNGPTDGQFETAREQLRTEMDLIDNLTLAEALTTAFLYPDQPVSDLTRQRLIVDTITSMDVRDLARDVFNPNQRIEVRQGPRS